MSITRTTSLITSVWVKAPTTDDCNYMIDSNDKLTDHVDGW